ncbi:MAG: aspartyl protease family protein [Cyanobacteria bacterium J06621_3]
MWHPYQSVSDDPKVPIAPVLRATLINPERDNDRIYELDAFLDTGSDTTLIPLEAVSVLRLPLLKNKAPVTGIGGGVTIGFMCRARLHFGEITIPFLKVASCEASSIGKPGQMIIGRDILNRFCVRFDGKRGRFLFEED